MIYLSFKLIFSGYVASSLLLFCYPTLIHKKINNQHQLYRQSIDKRRILRISHRGGARQAVQNTIEAFQAAKQVSDMFEMDVCQTKDGVLVVHHDKNLLRTCGVRDEVKDINFNDLPPLRPSISLQFSGQGTTMKTNGQTIPSLEEVFKQFPQILMNIQLKTPTERSIKELLRLIKSFDRMEKTIIGVRNHHQKEIRQSEPRTLRFFNDSSIGLLFAAYMTGLLPFLPIQEVSLQIPLYTEDFHNWKRRQGGDNLKTKFMFKAMKIANLMLRPMVWHLRKRGIMTFYWVCNNEEQFDRAIKCGACGIMTDQPFLLDNYLKSHFNGNSDSSQK